MKVSIGPYLTWVGPYQIADLLQHVGVSEDRCHQIGHKLAEIGWFSWICNKIYELKKRKIKIRIDRHDTWSMDHTLALIILPMLKQLRDTKNGSPCDMLGFQQTSNSAQYSFDFYADDDDLADQAGHKQWSDILDQMIWSFEQTVNEDSDLMFNREHNDKIRHGLQLFGTYYQSLWD